ARWIPRPPTSVIWRPTSPPATPTERSATWRAPGRAARPRTSCGRRSPSPSAPTRRRRTPTSSRSGRSAELEGGPERALDGGDAPLVARVEDPLLDPLGADQPRLRQDLQVLAGRGRADPQLVGDEQPAHAIPHEVAVLLRREVPPRPLQPVEDQQPPLVGEGLGDVHIHGKHIRQFAN